MTTEQKQSILAEIVKGENGWVEKSADNAFLADYVGQILDCRFNFTRTQSTTDEDGNPTEQEVVEEMACFELIETEDRYQVQRDMLSNYDGTEVYPYGHELAGDNILADLQSKELITLS